MKTKIQFSFFFLLGFIFSVPTSYANLSELIENYRQAEKDFGFLEGLTLSTESTADLSCEIGFTDPNVQYTKYITMAHCQAKASRSLEKALEKKLGRSTESGKRSLSFELRKELNLLLVRLKALNDKYNGTIAFPSTELEQCKKQQQNIQQELSFPSKEFTRLEGLYQAKCEQEKEKLLLAIEDEVKSGRLQAEIQTKIQGLADERTRLKEEILKLETALKEETLKAEKEKLRLGDLSRSKSTELERLDTELTGFRHLAAKLEDEIIQITSRRDKIQSEYDEKRRLNETQYQEFVARQEEKKKALEEQHKGETQKLNAEFEKRKKANNEEYQKFAASLVTRQKDSETSNATKLKELEGNFAARQKALEDNVAARQKELETAHAEKMKKLDEEFAQKQQGNIKQAEVLRNLVEGSKKDLLEFHTAYAQRMEKSRAEYAKDKIEFFDFTDKNPVHQKFAKALRKQFEKEFAEFNRKTQKSAQSSLSAQSQSSTAPQGTGTPKHHIEVSLKNFRDKTGRFSSDWSEVAFQLTAKVIHFYHEEDPIVSDVLVAEIHRTTGELKGSTELFTALTKFIQFDLQKAKARAVQAVSSPAGQLKLQQIEQELVKSSATSLPSYSPPEYIPPTPKALQQQPSAPSFESLYPQLQSLQVEAEQPGT